MPVLRIDPITDGRWREFINTHPAASIFHTPEWLEALRSRQPKVYRKCLARIIDLRREGNQLRRPLADYLRDGVRELRIKSGRVNYRILYSFALRAS